MYPRASAAGVRLTVGQALVRWLQAQWSERDGERRRAVPALWGIFGHGNALGLGQAVAQEGAGLPLHQPKHEQAMVHAALGYAKAARRLSLHACTASIGPGSTNLVTGAATATVNRLPVLLLAADAFATRRSGVVLQQLEHPCAGDVSVNDALRPVSRYFDRIARPEQLMTALPAALRVLLDPAETGAATLALPQDVLGEAFDWPPELFAERTWTVARRPPAREQLAAAAQALAEAERPLLIAGGGVRYSAAEDALAAFAAATGIPVAETSAGKGTLAPGSLQVGGLGVNGSAAANALAERADVVLCAGTRLTDFTTASLSLFRHPGVRFIGVNVCAADAHKLGALPVEADARLALEALTPLAPRVSTEHRAEAAAARERWLAQIARRGDGFDRAAVYAAVFETVRPGDWVIAAAGWAPGDLLRLWTVPRGVQAHLEFGFSCMGHELPAALGVRMHEGPAGEVFVVVGDGSLLMAPAELLTAVQAGLKVTVVVVDNAAYGSIDALARDQAGVSVGNALPAVDHAALARAFGARGVRVESSAELAAALADARAGDATTLVHCPVAEGDPPSAGAFWDLGVPAVADGREHKAIDRALQRRRTVHQRLPL
jgi:3D-(3,5/4)-trihydroxycyclohexane-1,2-dione acylhydrolase (decyclizing)